MDIESAINLVDKLVYQKTNEHLNSMQISLLRGVWFEQSYPEIAANCYCSVSYLKAQGSGFWKGLSQVLGEKVTCLINDLKIDFPNREIIVSLFEDPILPHYDVTMTTLIDKKLVKNILKELLFNALQYSSAESPVTLDINVENRKGTFSIIDQGIGINPDELSQIFLPFYCATNVSQKSRDGLGLTIVEKSVRLHQGEISVMTQLQKGSIFTVVLPVA